MTSRPVDAAVAEVFLEAVSPLSLRVATQVWVQVEQDLIAQPRQCELLLEQARYEAPWAQRQYDGGVPENRLVAWELERRWNEKMERVAELERPYAQAVRDAEWSLTKEERTAIAVLSQDLPAVWGWRRAQTWHRSSSYGWRSNPCSPVSTYTARGEERRSPWLLTG